LTRRVEQHGWSVLVTVSIRRMSLGSGYRYLMSSVARADGSGHKASALTRYYAESGTPPGRFLGAGLAGLNDGRGVEDGSRVSEEHLFRMLGMLTDPITGLPLGRPPRAPKPSLAARVRSRIETETKGLTAPERDQLIARIRQEERVAARKTPHAVAGFDLTFSVPKSVSAAWAVADAETQAVIYEAHQRALRYVLAYAERHVCFTRSGKNGVVQEEVRGVVGAAFDHWDSRAGDPHLHTHVVIVNRAQAADGRWRTLDSRALFKATVGLSEMHQAVLSDYLTAALGWGWHPSPRQHSPVPKYDVAGVAVALKQEFSTRTTAINEAADTLIAEFRAAHGRGPSSREVLQLRQQATLTTRPDKQVRPLVEMVARWRDRATPLLGTDPIAWVQTLRDRNDLPLLRAADLADGMLRDAAKVAVYTVSGKRATFSRCNLFAELHRQFMGVRFASPDDRMAVVHRAVHLALAEVLLISPPDLAHTPTGFRRADGTSKFRAPESGLYTTRALLDAEARLLDAGQRTTAPAVPAAVVADVAAWDRPGTGHRLSREQALAVEQIATSGRVLDVLVGPAGSGKSTTMAGLRAAWEHQHGPGTVTGLAPSATAADVLADQLGMPCENTAKWLTEAGRNRDRLVEIDLLRTRYHHATSSAARSAIDGQITSLAAAVQAWSFRSGQLVIVDEASLAGTFDLDALTEHAQNAGAKLLLVGDWAQLSAVTASGAFAMLVNDRHPAPELSDVRRFTHDWEKTASTDLRAGRQDAADTYHRHGRLTGGERAVILDQLYSAWQTDTEQGNSTLMIAADNQTVRELNNRARVDLIAAGRVQPDGVETDDGTVIGIGDRVVTRRNNRRLPVGRGWVKNGDQWTVTAISRDGALTVHRATGRQRGTAVLPARYAREHVELGYATTAHRAQGRTVDTAHAYLTATTHREQLYVMATRGREHNHLYVDTTYDPDTDTSHGPSADRDPVDVVRQVLATPGADQSATDTIRTTWAEQIGITQLWAEYDTIARHAEADRWDTLITSSGLTATQAARVRHSDAYGPLIAALRAAAAHGLDIDHALRRLAADRSLDGAHDVAAVLHARVDRWMAASGPGRRAPASRIAGLFPAAQRITDPDVRHVLEDRQAIIEQRARALAVAAIHHRQPWARKLGKPPADPARRATWLRQLATVAAYRDRWQITDSSVLGPANPTGSEQQTQRRLAYHAAQQAIAIQRDAQQTVVPLAHAVSTEPSIDGVHL
jgi:conjugative relaxase-like TrwC/TraI family protein